MNKKGKILYISHGGGPLPLLGDSGHEHMVAFLKDLSGKMNKPEIILVISAHWEEAMATVTTSPTPSLYYDYYGFPQEAYTVAYPVDGHAVLAEKIIGLLKKNNMAVKADAERGYDHGVFIPLKIMYPEAAIPTVQLSLVNGLDPEVHIALGKALQPLLDENILVIGSGFSFHNMRAFMGQGQGTPDLANDGFQDWLIETCTTTIAQTQREDRLIRWAEVPNARYCHPREEHLMPLHVCMGAADGAGEIIFDDQILGKRCIAVRW